MAESTERKNARDLLRVAFRRRTLFLLGAAMFAFAVLVGSHFVRLKYTGITKFQRDTDPAARMAGQQGSESFETLKQKLMHDLAGQQAVGEVVDQLGLTKGLRRNSEGELTREGELSRQLLVAALRNDIDVKWEVKSPDLDLVVVSVVRGDPQLAREIPDALVKNYIERTYKDIARRLTDSKDFLNKQVTECQTRLTELERQRVQFETEHARMMPESPGAVQKEIDRVEGAIAADQLQKQTAELRLGTVLQKVALLRKKFPEIEEKLRRDYSDLAEAIEKQGRAPSVSTPPTSGPAEGASSQPARLAASQPGEEPTTQPAIARVGAAAGPTTQPADAAGAPATQPAPVPTHVAKQPNPEYERLKAELQKDQNNLDLAQTVARMKDTHPTVQALRAKIESLEKRLKGTPTHIDVPIYATAAGAGGQVSPDALRVDPMAQEVFLTSAKSDMDMAKREIEGIANRLKIQEQRRGELLALMANIVPVRQQWQELTDKIQDQQKELGKWQARREEVQMTLAAEVAKRRTHLSTVQAAQQQILPSAPSLPLVMGFAIGGALAFAVGLAFLANLMDRSIATTEDALECFSGLPIHGVIGEILSRHQRRIRKLKRWLATPALATLALGSVAVSGLSIYLKLMQPDLFPAWKDAPLPFLWGYMEKGASLVSGLL